MALSCSLVRKSWPGRPDAVLIQDHALGDLLVHALISPLQFIIQLVA